MKEKKTRKNRKEAESCPVQLTFATMKTNDQKF